MAARKQTRKLSLDYVNPHDLTPYPDNPRMNELAVDAVRRSIESFGFIDPIIARKSDNMIIAGHTRQKSSIAAGEKEVPVIYVDMTDDEMKLFNIADNKLGELAIWDTETLSEIMRELSMKDVDLTLTGFEEAELDRLLNNIDDDELLEEKTEEIRAYKKTHVLLSFSPDKMIDLQELLERIRDIEGVEYEQSSN